MPPKVGRSAPKRPKSAAGGADGSDAEDIDILGLGDESETKGEAGSHETDNAPTIIVPECFKGKDYYQVLGVSRDASDEDINRAYKKMSLQYHPDRNRDRPSATEEFQYLTRVHKTLSGSKVRRSLYDKHGDSIVDQATDTFVEAYGVLRDVMPEVTPAQRAEFRTKYIGSEEEIVDVLEKYEQCKGNMFEMLNQELMFGELDTADHYTALVRKLISEGKISKHVPAFEKSLSTLKSKLKAFEDKEAALAEAKQREAAAKRGPAASLSDIAALIQSKAGNRASFFDILAAKYGDPGAGKKKGGAKAGAAKGKAAGGKGKAAAGGAAAAAAACEDQEGPASSLASGAKRKAAESGAKTSGKKKQGAKSSAPAMRDVDDVDDGIAGGDDSGDDDDDDDDENDDAEGNAEVAAAFASAKWPTFSGVKKSNAP